MKTTLLFPIRLKVTTTNQPAKGKKTLPNKQAAPPPKHQTKTTKLWPKSNQPKPKHQTKQTQILLSEMESVFLHWSEGHYTACRVKEFSPVRSWALAASGPVPEHRLKMCLNLLYDGVRSLSDVLAFGWHTCATSLYSLKWMQIQKGSLGEL